MITARSVVVACLAAPFLLAQDNPSAAKSAVDAAARAPQAPALVVGSVDLVRAFEQYPRWIKLKAELEKKGEAAKAQVAELTKAIDEQRAALAVMGPDSEDKRDGEIKLGLMEQQRSAMAKRLKEKLQIEEARCLIMVYEDLEVAIRKVAETRGVALVHRVHDTRDSPGDAARLSATDVDGRVRMFEMKHIWYASPQVDLTPDVIKLLMVPLEAKPAEKAAEKTCDAANGTKKDAVPAGGH